VIHHLPRPLRPAWLNQLIDDLDAAKHSALLHEVGERYWQLRCVQVTNQRNQLLARLATAEQLIATIQPTTTEGDTER
jgi:hypothetical protein